MQIENKSILVVGCIRNGEKNIITDLNLIQKAISNFKKKFFLIIESDSIDNTKNILIDCEKKIENFKSISLGSIRNNFKMRCDRIAHCRNIYVEKINNDEIYKKVDLILVVDLDGINNLLSQQSIQSCFERDDWDAVFANQKKAYYDVYALRHKYWSPTDCREELNFFDKFRKSRSYNYWHSVYSKMIEIPENADWIKVNSAFGGAAIYKRKCFENNFYSGKFDNKEVCEHVSFNENLAKRDLKLYICPKFINSGFNEHIKKKMSLRYKIKFAIQSLFIK